MTTVFGREPELREVAPSGKANAEFSFTAQLRIVLFETFPNFGRSVSNDRIPAGVIFGRTPEHHDTQYPLF
jgi:hypothetical protein